jgi:hypothetical protein
MQRNRYSIQRSIITASTLLLVGGYFGTDRHDRPCITLSLKYQDKLSRNSTAVATLDTAQFRLQEYQSTMSRARILVLLVTSYNMARFPTSTTNTKNTAIDALPLFKIPGILRWPHGHYPASRPWSGQVSPCLQRSRTTLVSAGADSVHCDPPSPSPPSRPCLEPNKQSKLTAVTTGAL